jgi:hypothetical protein
MSEDNPRESLTGNCSNIAVSAVNLSATDMKLFERSAPPPRLVRTIEMASFTD